MHVTDLKLIPLLAAMATVLAAPAIAAEPVSDIAALEARVAQLEAAAVAQVSANNALHDKVKINGFLSAGAATMDAKGFTYEGLNSDLSHRAESIVGLQVAGEVNDRTRAMVQLVARGSSNFAVGAEWAYIGYKPASSDEIRVGRQRYPFFMLSEYLEVGYSYPWARPPLEVYKPSMPSAIDAITWKHTANRGAWTHDLQAYWGGSEVQSPGTYVGIRNSTGLGLQSSAGNWLFSATASQGEMDVSQSFLDVLSQALVIQPAVGVVAQYGGLGVQYDDGNLLVMAETTLINVDGYFPDTEHAYVTLGYRIGKVMPHLTWSTNTVTDTAERAPNAAIPALCGATGFCLSNTGPVPFPADSLHRLLDSAQDSVTLGVRYDIGPSVAVKADWSRIVDTHGTFGYLDREDQNVFYGALPPDGIDVFRIVVDAMF